MSISRIFCFGDGYAHGHIWPEWPQILKALIPNREIILVSGIGAGNEFLINGLLQLDVTDQAVIFQWAAACRLDKIVEDTQWSDIGKNDPAYHFNFHQRDKNLWWLSSASNHHHVRSYHDFYIQKQQARTRLQDQKKLLAGYLVGKRCRYVEISTEQQEIYSQQKKFRVSRGSEIQPSPVVHLHFLFVEILPKLGIPHDQNRADGLYRAILNTDWKPYDPDRAEIWQNIVNSLDIDR